MKSTNTSISNSTLIVIISSILFIFVLLPGAMMMGFLTSSGMMGGSSIYSLVIVGFVIKILIAVILVLGIIWLIKNLNNGGRRR